MNQSPGSGNRLLLGVDTGGTFTDFVLLDGGTLQVHKVLSTPDAPERAILQGIAELGVGEVDFSRLLVVHGSTVATNAVLEGKGVRTAYISNHGLKDVLTIGRQARHALYDLQPAPKTPPVPAELCLESGGRLSANGSVVEDLTDADLAELHRRLAALDPGAVAINLLFSFLDDRFERAVEAAVPEGVFVSRSSAILPEYREYERGITTWLNAWVGPLVQGYLERLKSRLPGAGLSVMQSSGTTIEAAQAGRQAVHMLLSGPAGGLAGSRRLAAQAGFERLLTFDMGGTSTDVALIEGELELTTEGKIGHWPVSVPMVDMHTIGAGGGSIANVDAGGLLQVGPESAGALPGPACYGRGGERPTVTDANLLLGRLLPGAFLGGGMHLDVEAAREVMARVADPLGLSVEEAAEGVILLANEHMASALRVMSVQRGIDPRRLTLTSFGGAGGLHVCALADELGMTRALVPVHAGVLSALGMLVAPRGRQLSKTLKGLLDTVPEAILQDAFETMETEGSAELAGEGVDRSSLSIAPSVDLRYAGQSYTLNIPWTDRAAAADSFHRRHQAAYGHRLDLPVELVNVRVGLFGPEPELELESVGRNQAKHLDIVQLCGVMGEAKVWRREDLSAGQVVEGPALVVETVATTYIAPRWRALVDPVGNLVLEC